MHASRMPTVRCSSHLVCGGGGGGVSAQGVVSAWGVSAEEGGNVCPGRGVCHTPPVNSITDACENITLPQLRCGR